jgi:hypothetical protein
VTRIRGPQDRLRRCQPAAAWGVVGDTARAWMSPLAVARRDFLITAMVLNATWTHTAIRVQVLHTPSLPNVTRPVHPDAPTTKQRTGDLEGGSTSPALECQVGIWNEVMQHSLYLTDYEHVTHSNCVAREPQHAGYMRLDVLPRAAMMVWAKMNPEHVASKLSLRESC